MLRRVAQGSRQRAGQKAGHSRRLRAIKETHAEITDMGGRAVLFKNLTKRAMKLALKGSGVALADETEAKTSEFSITCPPPSIALRMVLNPEFWVPEAYRRGHWLLAKGDLGAFSRHMMDRGSQKLMGRFTSKRRRWMPISHLIKHWVRPLAATRKVKVHYDIDERIYEMILDPEMVYTAAFFDGTKNLAEAQQAKLSRIMERLELERGARVLNMGCGWASLERHMVRSDPTVDITGLTISQGQLQWAEKHNAEQLTTDQQARVALLLEDFRHHQPDLKYDSVCSVGMFEHIGRSLYRDFFERCHDLVKSDGTILVHTIVKNRSNVATNRWIDRHIFPGGYIASLAEILRTAEAADLDVESVYLHSPTNYGSTCYHWRCNLMNNRAAILDIYVCDHGFSREEAEAAYRTWEIYLAGAEAGFLTKERPMQTAQIVFRPTGHTNAHRIEPKTRKKPLT